MIDLHKWTALRATAPGAQPSPSAQDPALLVPPQPNVPGGGVESVSGMFWALLLVTGIGAGLSGGLLMVLLRGVQHAFWDYRTGDFLHAVQAVSGGQRILLLLLAAALVAAVRWVSRQAGGGHGAELTAAIWFHGGKVAPVRGLTNAVRSIVIVGLGASLGREAAPKQAGAVIASLLASWAALPTPQRRLLAACGAGAGMAAVYNVPLGGGLFALEVLLGTLSLSLVAPALAASVIAVGVSWLILPDRVTYQVPAFQVTPGLVAYALLAGPLAGLVSVAYVRLICSADSGKPKGLRWHGLRLVAAPLLAFLALGFLSIAFPQLLGNGKDVVQLAIDGQMRVPLLLALLLLKPLVTAACLGSGAPGGLFTPTMSVGALFGALLGHGVALIWPSAPVGCAALIGAVAVLAAATQGPVSSIVLVLEMTRHMDRLMVPMLFAVVGSVLVARLLEPRSIYSGRIHAAKSVSRGDARTVSAAEPYADVVRRFLRMGDARTTLRVVDESGDTVGEIRESDVAAPVIGPLAIATAGDFARPAQ